MSNSPPAEAGEAVLAVLAEAKKVVIDSKALVQLVQNTENQVDDMEDKLLTLARSLATTTHQVRFICPSNSLFVCFLICFNLIFKNVLFCRKYFLHTYDFCRL